MEGGTRGLATLTEGRRAPVCSVGKRLQFLLGVITIAGTLMEFQTTRSNRRKVM